MSNNNDPTRNVTYDPLPLTNDDYPSNILYNAPPSPDPNLSTFHTPQMDIAELGPSENTIPPGAAQPRFLGAAFYDGSGSPSMRNSFASSNHTIPGTHSEYNSSLFALNDPQGSGRFDGNYRDDPRDTTVVSPANATPRILEEKRAAYAPAKTKLKRRIIIIAVIVALILIIVAVVLPLYFLVIKPSSRTSNSDTAHAGNASDPSSTPTSSGGNEKVRVTGGDGSVITMEDGTTFTYNNSFGGYWYWDDNDPFNPGARAQSWSPALNETFNYGADQIRGSVLRL